MKTMESNVNRCVVMFLITFLFCPFSAIASNYLSKTYYNDSTFVYTTILPDSSEPIQDTFYGARFGTSQNNACGWLANKGIKTYSEYNVINAYDVMFGGLSWNFLSMHFNANGLYNVSFSMYFQIKSDAISAFDGLSSSLGSKYAIIDWSHEQDCERILYTDSNYLRTCSLSYEYGISKGGNWYYYVSLKYTDNELYEATEDEL